MFRCSGGGGVSVAVLGIAQTGRSAAATCPDEYVLTSVILVPQYADKDKNGNFIVCTKTPPSSNGHANGKDDKLDVVDDITSRFRIRGRLDPVPRLGDMCDRPRELRDRNRQTTRPAAS